VGPDSYTLTAVIDVLRRGRDWRKALPVLEELAHTGEVGKGLLTSLNALLEPLGREDFSEARMLLRRAQVEWGLEPDGATYGTLMLAVSKGIGELDSGFGENRVNPGEGGRGREGLDGVRGVIRGRDGTEGGGAGKSTALEELVTLVCEAAALGAVPNASCLNLVMFNLARRGAWVEAAAFVSVMRGRGLAISRKQVYFDNRN
ncbi:unnamed protein product, partial [Choristocarpus tenellus]